ncbi:ATP-binding cassette domain-containing protein [Hyphococcus luteus]|uniref:Metal ABC transporter permease n=1 Tax=Hyphococcus luteus TaxID=2058213 RepID=A0A2S7K3W0_9PROT|nr:ABC transporter ATP-binding protein [Marinicaulis flavus]PQA87185.1 metal ABC transporter permease [Marinicaulis flavus]
MTRRSAAPLWALKQASDFAWRESDGAVKMRLAATIALALCGALLSGLSPVLLKYAVDGLEPSTPTGDGAGNASGALLLVLLYVAALLAARLLAELRARLIGEADQRLQRRLAARLISHVIDLPLSFHLRRRTGALTQTLAQGLAGYRVLIHHSAQTIIPVFAETLIVAGVLVSRLPPEFLIILAVSLAAYLGQFALAAARIVGPARAAAASQLDMSAAMTDSLINAETVKSLAAEERIASRFDRVLAENEERWRRFYRRKSRYGGLAAGVFAASLGASLGLAAFRVGQDVMSIGDFVMMNAYMLQLMRPVEMLGASFREILQAAANLERMMALAREAPEPDVSPAAPGGAARLLPGCRLEVEKVSFSYGDGAPVVDDVSFTAEPGRVLALVGPSGAGKSSLLRLLLRFYMPQRGDIRLGGQSIGALGLKQLRQAVAVVPQDIVLFDDTIAFNIALARPGASHDEIEAAARAAGVHERIAAMPDGYATIVGERGLKLSGGERQRLSIARALVKRPRLLVLDEATSSLDAVTEKIVRRSLMAGAAERTTLVVAHNLAMAAGADEILVMAKGRIVERGSHRDLIRRKGLYARLWREQMQSGDEKA